ncbi:hypothetical protein BET04_07245 [Caminicella sporogenes]|nr:hypothetical protein BET04_07245 [Caminicella sporogenes]
MKIPIIAIKGFLLRIYNVPPKSCNKDIYVSGIKKMLKNKKNIGENFIVKKLYVCNTKIKFLF